MISLGVRIRFANRFFCWVKTPIKDTEVLSAVKAIRMVMASLVVLCHGLPWFQLKDDSWHPSEFPSLEMDSSNERFGGLSNFKPLPYIIKKPREPENIFFEKENHIPKP